MLGFFYLKIQSNEICEKKKLGCEIDGCVVTKIEMRRTERSGGQHSRRGIMKTSSTSAQDCLEYRDFLPCVGAVDTPGEAQGVAVTGNYAYVADGNGGL